MCVSLSTGHRWLDEWNEGGYKGLYPKYKNGGEKLILTDEQFKKLDEIMINESFLSTRKRIFHNSISCCLVFLRLCVCF
jgi:transposase